MCISFSWQCHTFTTQAESLNNSFYAQSQLLNWILQDLMSNSVSCLCTRHNDRNKSCNTSPRWICISPPKFKEKSSILFSKISDFVSVSYEQHVRSQPAKTLIDFSPNRLPRKKNPGTNSVLEKYNSIKKL